ncbi:MAG TPA: hypothetical protein PLI09_08795 [Candidatus Hydrogenedentes bacterium]|nr:hypothetical protein [Candidatus Hydrogenedentota bacterium]
MGKKIDLTNQLIDDFIDYQQTVRALLALVALVVHDGHTRRPNTHFGFGRRMTTSNSNMFAPKTDVTPDLVVQKQSDYGIIAEVKRSLERDQNRWTTILEQLRKYDDNLKGWWTKNEKIQHRNTILLLHQSRSRTFVKYTETVLKKDKSLFGPLSSIIEFGENQERQVFYHFRLEYGKIDDKELNSKLEEGIQVPIEKVVETLSNIQYYDGDPPLLLVLVNLWSDYFPSLIESDCYDPESRTWNIKASISETVNEIQKAHGSGALQADPRSCQFPRKDAIKSAFQFLVDNKLAQPTTGEKNSAYTIKYRKIKADIKEYFAALISKKSKGTTDISGQMYIPGL